ncbi:hypothetical protein PQ472_07595 [Lacticaseibacillus pabuli]|uniref:Uncharacterized protein n=1 Tax=Lacticaseibacillus pabuli TaxID=3025672 RepID=A0ABY7WS10_9LACO|nr:hypothetical protein [Lacticaseibacillus sp. KACC 23028]WDF81787.1 hypothetical protein PQ472_07595 [Lacticaseibacillus sp. KACC 23028]
MYIVAIILNTFYAVATLILALRSFRRKKTNLALMAIVLSVCLLLTPLIRDFTVARALLVLLLAGIASIELLGDLHQGRGPFWGVHFTRLLISVLIIIGFSVGHH